MTDDQESMLVETGTRDEAQTSELPVLSSSEDPSWSEAAWAEVVQNVLASLQSNADSTMSSTEAPLSPGDLLQLVLSMVLEQTQSPGLHVFLKEKLHELRATQNNDGEALDDSDSHNNYELPTTLYEILTTVVALDAEQTTEALVLSNIKNVSDTTTTTTASHQKWWTGLLMMAALLRHADMTAFDVHLAATQMAFLGPLSSNQGDADADDQDVPSKRARREHHSKDEEHPVVFWTLLFVLSCWSLQQCHKMAVVSLEQPNSKTIRWKRLRSLLIETLQLYQRHILNAPAVAADDNQQVALPKDEFLECSPPPLTALWYTVSVALWVEHILPVCQALWTILPQDVQNPSSFNTVGDSDTTTVFWHATAVSITTHLAERGPEVLHGAHHDDCVQLLGKLYSSLSTLDFDLDTVWSHPWRVSHHTSLRLARYIVPNAERKPRDIRQDNLEWWTLDRWDSQDDDEVEDNNSNGDDDDSTTTMDEFFDGIVTTWSDIGLASLAWVHWHEGNTNRPLGDYSPQYEWQTGLPHVAVLLNTEEHPNSSNPRKAVISLEYLARGMALLLSLLPKIAPQSLEIPALLTIVDQPKRNDLASAFLPPAPSIRPPDHPAGLFELLLNVIVVASSQQTPSQPDNAETQVQIFPSAMEVYLLCKEVLSKYTPEAQLEIVLDNLLSGTCPYPSLRPKILDLLRPLLAQLCSSPSSNSDDHEALRMHLWKSLEKMIMGLDRYYQRGQEGKIQDTDDLIDETEFFVSVCAMLQLGWNMMRNNGILTTQKETLIHPRSIAAVWITSGTGKEEKLEREVTLQEFHAVLKAQLEHWLKSPASAPPAPVFRLSLLDNAIEELLNLENV